MDERTGVRLRDGEIVATTAPMRDLLARVDDFARFDVPILIGGETGTGKELVARRVHGRSRRARAPWVAINCAALPETLLEAELFGHARGAFTGAGPARDGLLDRANGGTLFLDEVGDLPPRAQTTLLRVLQEKEFRRLGDTRSRRSDFRLVAASHRDLEKEVAEGRFRLDLLYRLGAVRLFLPALRDRRGDIGPLARRALDRHAHAGGLTPKRLSDGALSRLERHDWPGNVRELEHEMLQALVRAQSDAAVEPCHLDVEARTSGRVTLRRAALELERRMVEDALARMGGNRTRAARALGLSRQGLYRKLKRLGVA